MVRKGLPRRGSQAVPTKGKRRRGDATGLLLRKKTSTGEVPAGWLQKNFASAARHLRVVGAAAMRVVYLDRRHDEVVSYGFALTLWGVRGHAMANRRR
jgi:hypothetical protein